MESEEKAPEILYLCNRKQKCSTSIFCKTLECMHTTKEEYALNGPCEHPEKSDRFDRWPDGSYVEDFLQEYKKLKENREDMKK